MIARLILAACALWMALCLPAEARTDIHSERSLYRNIVVYEDDGLRCMVFNMVLPRLAGESAMA